MPALAPPESGIQQMKVFPVTPFELRKRVCDFKDRLCPFYDYVGNDKAKRTATDLAKLAFDSHVEYAPNKWVCNRHYSSRILLTGPRSVGKTTFARAFGAIISVDWDNAGEQSITDPKDDLWLLPWAEVDSTGIKKREELLQRMMGACKAKGTPMVCTRVEGGVRWFTAPPMIVFFDEVHGLPKSLMEGFLKMTEPNDGIFEVGVQTKVDCRLVTFIGGTTNPGAITDTLMSRFAVQLELQQHSPEQIAEMITRKFGWSKGESMALASMKSLPREALAVADLVHNSATNEKVTISVAMKRWAENLGLKPGGLSEKAVEVLRVLKESAPTGLSRANICASMAMEEEEFTKRIIPQLLRSPYHPAFITVAGRHKITDAGIKEVQNRDKGKSHDH